MTKTRADSWTDQQDNLLASIVLKHIQAGSQQLRAFEEASDELERTSAACAFRWNATTKRGYEKELKKAFKIRRQSQSRKVASLAVEKPTFEDSVEPTFEDSVEQTVTASTSSTSALTARYEDVIDTIQEEKRQLLEYNRMLLQENKELKEMRDSVLRILS